MSRRHYIGIFCLSSATLLLELALTRVLSVANWYHFGFLVISVALLGFGTSGVVLTLWTNLRERVSLDHALAALSIAFGIVAGSSYCLMQFIPFDPFELLSDRRQLLFMPLYCIVAASPFFCSGLAIALLLFRGRQSASRLYAADLLGAGLGCAAIAVVMPVFGGSGSVLLAAALGFIAASVFGVAEARRLAAAGITLAILATPLALIGDRLIPISVTSSKRHGLQPVDNTAPIYSAWNTFSRVDVYRLPAAPEKGRPDAGFSIIIDAGAAGTAIPDLSAGAREYLRSPHYRPNGIPYVGKAHPKVLILGSGSGREVLEALDFGAQSVTAVDINPIVNNIVTDRMRTYWGGLFEQPEVHLFTEDGRSFVRRSREKYDVIISVQTMMAAAVTSGAMTLAESYLFTREAFADYLDHLTPDGIILMTRPPLQIVKLFATAREVFERRGLGDPSDHLISFYGPLAPYGATLFNSGMLFKKSPWTADELRLVAERLDVGHPERWFGSSPEIHYSPGMRQPQPGDHLSTVLTELLAAPKVDSFYAAHQEQFSPATDDRPFFNQNLRWTSLRPSNFREIFFSDISGSVTAEFDAMPVAEVMLIVLLFQTSLLAFALIMLPLARRMRHGLQISRAWPLLVYFGGLGLGFIMIEIVCIQRFILFLGEPVYTFAVVLAGLLGFAGIGSWIVGRLGGNFRLSLAWIIPSILVVLLLTAIMSPWIFSSTLGLPLPWRIVIVVAMLGPLGTLLGMPFPAGLRIVADEAPAFVPWAWGVNGFLTVVGSVGAWILGMIFGFTMVLAVSGACYLAALLAMTIVRTEPARRDKVITAARTPQPNSSNL
jgi:SAM-dependent methyltransferase